MKQRVLLKDGTQDRKQRMFIYVLAFVVMTATLGIFAWGHDLQGDDAADADYHIEYEYNGADDVPYPAAYDCEYEEDLESYE